MSRTQTPEKPPLLSDLNPWEFTPQRLPEKIEAQVFKQNFESSKNINDLQFILKDIMQGDNDLRDRPEYSHLNFPAIKAALSWLIDNDQMDESLKVMLLNEPWKMNFKAKPPTPIELLDERYLGPMMENLWRPIRRNFIDFFDPLKAWRTAVFCSSIGSGKSTLVCLIYTYIAICFALMWSPHRYFSKMSTSVFALVFCAVSMKKGSEVYLEPIIQLFESSPFFERVRTHGEMKEAEHEYLKRDSIDKIVWTTSTPSSILQSLNGLNWKLSSSANSLLGVNILGAAMTELSFFHEAGWGEDKIRTFFTKLRQRISNRFASNYYARMILDSSPYSTEQFPDSWIWSEARESPDNFFYEGSRWELFPEEFPDVFDVEYDEVRGDFLKNESNFDWDNSFKLYLGGNGKLPIVCDTEGSTDSFENVDLIWVPRRRVTTNGSENYVDKALENPIEFMRDVAGRPTGTADRIFYDPEKIEFCFNNGLKNVYGCIKAPAMENPEHLIWDQVAPTFFYKVMDKYYYYYAPDAARCISVDQSKVKDMTCISMSHVERDKVRKDPETNQPMSVYVTDFTILINPKGGLINLDAIKFFIFDLRRLGNLRIVHTSFDGYESASTKQFLLRNGFTVDYVSVDKDNSPYLTLIDMVFKGRWFCGRNAFIKNNMKALQYTKRKGSQSMKLDHTKGELVYDVTGNWDLDLCGCNAKDALDAVAGNVWLMTVYSTEFPPSHVFDPSQTLSREYESIIEKNQKFLDTMHLG